MASAIPDSGGRQEPVLEGLDVPGIGPLDPSNVALVWTFDPPTFECDRLIGLSGTHKDPIYSPAINLDKYALACGEPLSHRSDCSRRNVLYLIDEQSLELAA